MVECEDRLAGYGWTLQGQTIEPYYFPLAPDDVQLFDFYVFPKFRGRAIHWLLTGHILHAMAAEGGREPLPIPANGIGRSWPRSK